MPPSCKNIIPKANTRTNLLCILNFKDVIIAPYLQKCFLKLLAFFCKSFQVYAKYYKTFLKLHFLGFLQNKNKYFTILKLCHFSPWFRLNSCAWKSNACNLHKFKNMHGRLETSLMLVWNTNQLSWAIHVSNWVWSITPNYSILSTSFILSIKNKTLIITSSTTRAALGISIIVPM